MKADYDMDSLEAVAPLAGAWIEILYPSVMHSKSGSLPSRERGLKCHDQSVQQFAAVSLPSRERGLKFKFVFKFIHAARRSPRGSVD